MNKIMYAIALGLYLMKEPIPDGILKYINETPPETENRSVWLALTCLRNAPNIDDYLLFSHVVKLL
jgi:hypothetical protein